MIITLVTDPMTITIEAGKSRDEKYADCPWWFEVAVGGDEDEMEVFETDGMFETAKEAHTAGWVWLNSKQGRIGLRKAVARVIAKRGKEDR